MAPHDRNVSVNPPLDPEAPSYPTPRTHFNATLAAAGIVEVATTAD